MHEKTIIWKVNARCNNPRCIKPFTAVRYHPRNYPHPQPVCCSYDCAVEMARLREEQKAALHGHRAAIQALGGKWASSEMVRPDASTSETPMEGVVGLANCPSPIKHGPTSWPDIAGRVIEDCEQDSAA